MNKRQWDTELANSILITEITSSDDLKLYAAPRRPSLKRTWEKWWIVALLLLASFFFEAGFVAGMKYQIRQSESNRIRPEPGYTHRSL
jgi:hypothetical protein